MYDSSPRALAQLTAAILLCAPSAICQSFEVVQGFLFVMQAPTPPASRSNEAASASPRRLRIVPLEGNNARNIITTGISNAPVVTILDDNDRPVEGATVTFTLPSSGPGGLFAGEQKSSVTRSDSRGQAGDLSFVANNQPGSFDIRVSAELHGASATAVLRQTNFLTADEIDRARPHPLWKNWKFWAAVGAAGAGAAILSSVLSGPAAVSVSAGPVVIAGPR